MTEHDRAQTSGLAGNGRDLNGRADPSGGSLDARRDQLQAHVLRYLTKGLTVLAGQKHPGAKWSTRPGLTTTEASMVGPLANLYLRGDNGFFAIDLDVPGERTGKIAEMLGWETMAEGRPSKPVSHIYVNCRDAPEGFTVDKAGDIEIRGQKHVTRVTPSRHQESGECLAFLPGRDENALQTVSWKEVRDRVGRARAASALADVWKAEGQPGRVLPRHDVALAVAALLMQSGWDAGAVEQFLRDVIELAGDSDGMRQDYREGIGTTEARIAHGEAVSGFSALADAFGKEQVSKIAEWLDLPNRAGHLAGDRVPIFTGQGDLMLIADEVWAALGAKEEEHRLFRLNGDAVRIDLYPDEPPQARVLGHDDMRLEMTRAAWFYKIVRGEFAAAYPPETVIRQVRSVPDPPLRPLSRIVTTPVFGPAGVLETEPGYHAGGRTYYAPAPGFHVPAVAPVPSTEELAAALEVIGELIHDFPFAGTADKTNAIGELLLVFARALIPGATPIHLHTAPKPRTGKDLLAEVVAIVATGKDPATLTYTENGYEMQNRLTARLRTLPQVILIPNVAMKVTDTALCDAVTRGLYEGRILGSSEIVTLPGPDLWQMSANNLTMTDELAERSVEIRLDANAEYPGARDPQRFKHHPLKAWARENRGRLVWACLTVVQSWLVSGSPRWTKRTRGGFEAWAEVVGGILDHAGLPDFLANLDSTRLTVSPDDEARIEFVKRWWAEFGVQSVKARQLYDAAAEVDGLYERKARDEQGRKTEFGLFLPKLRDNIYAGRKIVLAGSRGHANTYGLQPVEGSGFDPEFKGRKKTRFEAMTGAADEPEEPGQLSANRS